MLDFSEIPTNEKAFSRKALPADTYTVRIAGGTIERTKKGGIMPVLELRIEDGVATGHQENGMVHFERFWLGHDKDPDGEDPATRLQKGYADRYTLLTLIAYKALGGSFESRGRGEAYYRELITRLQGKRLRMRLTTTTEPASAEDTEKKKAGLEYETRERNEIKGVWTLDEKLPGQRVNGPAGQARVVPRTPIDNGMTTTWEDSE